MKSPFASVLPLACIGFNIYLAGGYSGAVMNPNVAISWYLQYPDLYLSHHLGPYVVAPMMCSYLVGLVWRRTAGSVLGTLDTAAKVADSVDSDKNVQEPPSK